jgi:phosphoserine phosphatase RsbU/P
MFQNRGLAYKISSFVLLGTIITYIVMIGINSHFSRTLLTRYLLGKERNITFSTINSIETELVSIQKITFNLALLVQNSDILESNLNQYISNIVKYNPEVYACCIAYEPNMYHGKVLYAPYYYKKDGKLTFINLPENNYEYLYKDWYQIPKTLDKPMWSEPYFDEGASDIIMSTYSVPFYSIQNGKKVIKGIVAIDMSLGWLQRYLNSIHIGTAGYVSIISRKGTYIAHPKTEYIMNETVFSSGLELNRKDILELGKKMVKGETGVAYMKSQVYQQGSWVFYSPIPSNQWSVGVVIPEKVYGKICLS